MTTSTPPRSRARRLAAVALGLTVVLGACGGSAATGSKTTDAGSNPDAGKTGSPLEQLLAGSTAGMRAMEDEIASCMRSRGWEYTPNTAGLSRGMTSMGAMDAGFRDEYGYGISTQPPVEALGGTVMGGDDDPNAKYANTLSEADRDRYYKDLFGGGLVADAGTDGGTAVVTEFEADPNACTTKAQAAVAAKYPEMGDAFSKRLGELFADMEDHPTMQAATKAWSACMAKANYTYDDQQAIFEDLARRSGEILGTGGDGAGGDGGAVAGVMVGGPTPSLSAADQERLTRLQTEERAIAKADAACAADTIDKARPELEKEIADKLRSEFPGVGGRS